MHDAWDELVEILNSERTYSRAGVNTGEGTLFNQLFTGWMNRIRTRVGTVRASALEVQRSRDFIYLSAELHESKAQRLIGML